MCPVLGAGEFHVAPLGWQVNVVEPPTGEQQSVSTLTPKLRVLTVPLGYPSGSASPM